MGRILIFSEMFEVRELIARDFAIEDHLVAVTGNPALIQDLIRDFNPDLVLLDCHLNRINPWKGMRPSRKMSARTFILPFSAYTNGEGNIRLAISGRGEGALSVEAFKNEMNTFLNPSPSLGKGIKGKLFIREAGREFKAGDFRKKVTFHPGNAGSRQ